MIRARGLLWMLLAAGLCLHAGGATADGRYPVASRSGVIEGLDFSASTMIVSGYRYRVPVDVQVEIAGSYGAFTMLRPGMRIRFDYLVVSPSERRMVLIQELPAHVKLEQT